MIRVPKKISVAGRAVGVYGLWPIYGALGLGLWPKIRAKIRGHKPAKAEVEMRSDKPFGQKFESRTGLRFRV